MWVQMWVEWVANMMPDHVIASTTYSVSDITFVCYFLERSFLSTFRHKSDSHYTALFPKVSGSFNLMKTKFHASSLSFRSRTIDLTRWSGRSPSYRLRLVLPVHTASVSSRWSVWSSTTADTDTVGEPESTDRVLWSGPYAGYYGSYGG